MFHSIRRKLINKLIYQ